MKIEDFFNQQNMKITQITNSKSEYSKHMLVQTSNNEIYAFGKNNWCQCGYVSGKEELKQPILLQYFVRNKVNIIHIKKGVGHTWFISDQHML